MSWARSTTGIGGQWVFEEQTIAQGTITTQPAMAATAQGLGQLHADIDNIPF
jgi:hypothetical protein